MGHYQFTSPIFLKLLGIANPLYTSVGCFKDTGTRAIQTLEGKDKRLDGSYGSRKDAIEKCYAAAKEKGYKYFAVQHDGWCAASANAESRYKMYGKATNCKGGKGGGWANDVYVIEGKKYLQNGLFLLISWL